MATSQTRSMFKSKIHRATVTHADLDYEGSVTIDVDLLEAANILPYEEVHIWNITRGSRLSTYAIEGDRGSGVICINGAAAHLCRPGDLVILATFVQVDEALVNEHRPTVVLVDEANRMKVADLVEIPGPRMRV
jgi:aspartate 1-decarboxylase